MASAPDNSSCGACEHDYHLLCFPQWQGSDNSSHLPGGHAAAALVESRLGTLPSVMHVEVEEAEAAAAEGSNQSAAALVESRLGTLPSVMHVEVEEAEAAAAEGSNQSDASVHHLAAIIRQSNRARELLQRLPKPASRVFTVGGDCGVEVQPVFHAGACSPGLAVVWFDAHADLNSPSTSPSGHFHGMPVRTLLGEGPAGLQLSSQAALTPSQIIYVGTRDLDPPEQAFIEAHGMCLLPPRPSSTLASRLAAALRGFSAAYIHVDLDVLDPSEFPCTCCPTADGLALQTLLECLGTVKRAVGLVAGVGLTECCGDPSSHAPQLAAVVDGLAASLERAAPEAQASGPPRHLHAPSTVRPE